MAFHVTQCPSCESSFNTSAQVLQSAAGKVRCGACLTVFNATEHFIEQQIDTDPQSANESVFVGNNPLDYFDPSSFLTRRALQEKDSTEPPVAPESEPGKEKTTEQGAEQSADGQAEPGLELPDANINDFMEAVADAMDVALDEALPDESLEDDNGLQESTTEESESGQGRVSLLDAQQADDDDTVIEIPEADDTDSIEDKSESRLRTDQQSAKTWQDYQAPEREPLEQESQEQEIDPEELAEQESFSNRQTTERQLSLPGEEMAELASQLSKDHDDFPPMEDFVAHSITEIRHPSDNNALERSGIEASEKSTSEPETVHHAPAPLRPQAQQSRPEDLRLSISFSMFQGPARINQDRDSTQETTQEPAEGPPENAAESADEGAEHYQQLEELNQEIVEHDFQETIAEGLEPAGDEFEAALSQDLTEEQKQADTAENSESTEPVIEIDEHTHPESITSPDDSGATESVGEQTSEEVKDIEPAQAIGENQEQEITDTEAAPAAQEDTTEVIRARALESELEDEEALEVLPEENLAALDEFSTPVELLTGKQIRWGRQILLSLAILAMGVLLAGQYLLRHMSVYSQVASVRPFYEFACNWANCDLPVYSNIAAIRSDNLVVRSHPELDNGLMVNVAFRNTARFPQPFPILILSFNSAANEIVALREFSPQEYLDPSLQRFTEMPVMTPVQLDMEIIDPGPGAVNYTLAFRRP